jgi:dTDP-4-amino-4,6-dideoxygalactose transaminase
VLCALGISQMRKLEGFLERRRELAAYYGRHLAGLAPLELPHVSSGIESAWHLYVLRVREAARRGAFFAYLRERGIAAQVHYHPVYLHPVFRELGYRRGACPRAEDFAARAISIPLYPKLRDDDAARVVDVVSSACRAVL